MINDLERFSEEELTEIINDCTGEIYNTPTNDETTVSPRALLSLARIALASKQAKPIGEIRLSEYRSDGTREASVVCLHDQADWDNFTDGTLLYLSPQPAHTEQDGWVSIPKDMLADYRDVKNGEVQAYKASFGSHCDIPRSRWQRDLADLTEELAEIDKLISATPKPE